MLVDSFGHIITIDPLSPPANITTGSEMAREIADIMNGADDVELRSIAFRGIKWAIAFANIAKRMRFAAKQTQILPLVEGSNTIAVPFDFIGVREVRYMMTDVNPAYPSNLAPGKNPAGGVIPYESYPQFLKEHPDLQLDDPPVAWSARNTFADRQLLFRSRPSSTAVANWQVQIDYDSPITLPESQGDIIIAPKDFEIVIKEGAKYFLLFERKRDDVQGYRFQYSIFEQMLDRYELNDQKRNSHQNASWRIGAGT